MGKMVISDLMEINEKRILDYVSKVVRMYRFDEDTNQDVVQDIMVKYYCNASEFKGKSKLTTWLYSVIKNHCLNLKQKIYKNYLLSMNFNDWDTLPGKSENTESSLLYNKVKAMITAHVNKLPDYLQLPIRYFYYQDMLYKDIALKMNIPIGTVKSRINTAKNMLKKWFVTKPENAALLSGGRNFKEFIYN